MSRFGEALVQSLGEALAHSRGEGLAIVHAPLDPAEVRKRDPFRANRMKARITAMVF